METVDEVLAHFGVKGMKWGVRRRGLTSSSRTTKTPSGHISEDARKAHEHHSTVTRARSTDPLSNPELKHLVERIDLEQRYVTSISKSNTSAGKKFAQDVVQSAGKQQATKLANDALGSAIGAALKKK